MDDGRRPRQYPSRRAIVLEGIIAVAECDSDDDVAWNRAWSRFWGTIRLAGWAPKNKEAEPAE